MRHARTAAALAVALFSTVLPAAPAHAEPPTLLRVTGGARLLLGREYTWCSSGAWTGVPVSSWLGANAGGFCTRYGSPGFEVTGLLEGDLVFRAGYSCLQGVAPPYPGDPYVQAGSRIGHWSHDVLTMDLVCPRVSGTGPDEARFELRIVNTNGTGTVDMTFTATGYATHLLPGTVEFSNLAMATVGWQDTYVHAADLDIEAATE